MAKPFDEIFNSFTSVMELLRDKEFQKLLVNYERAKKVFLVGYEVQDEVSSRVLFEAEGRYGLKPEDYLIAFSQFVIQKETEIEAISILLNKPKDWNTKALNELKQKLKESKYDDANLQKAHRIVYQKDAVDIISMVKHAANATEPLLSPEERVDRAIQRVTAGKSLTDDQQKWMEYIKEHLKLNMTLGKEDFYDDPVLERKGGFKKFKEAFANEYELIINQINKEIAA